jgi:Asp-tRNA(Asn)/Glu-tRNA(Gln) amidotransferase B subunit
MATTLTYRELRKKVRALAKEVRQATEAHKKLAKMLGDEAKDTGRIAEQIAALKVDSATVAETREVSRIMQGLSTTALAYSTAADEASRDAIAADQEAVRLHDGIQQAVDKSPVPMAKASWYTQE